MTTIQDNISMDNNYYEYANKTTVNKTATQNDDTTVNNNLEEEKVIADGSNELSQESTYSKKTLLGMDKKDILANMLEHMSNAEKSEKIRELKGEINPAEIFLPYQ